MLDDERLPLNVALRILLRLVIGVYAIASEMQAQGPVSFRYFYDDLDELTKVVDSTGIVIQYIYDPVGNRTEIKRSVLTNPAGPSIFNLTPARTGAGGTITIQGQALSLNPAQNIVKINGIAATVLSATANTFVSPFPSMSPAARYGNRRRRNRTMGHNIAIVPFPLVTCLNRHRQR